MTDSGDVTELHGLLRDRNHVSNRVREVVSASPEILWKSNSIGWNALHVAASVGWSDEAWLLEKATECADENAFISERTHNGGHSCISLFFRRHVDPLPWHHDEVKEAAATVKGGSQTIVDTPTLLDVCRSRIQQSQPNEQLVEGLNREDGSADQTTKDAAVSRVVEFWRRMELWLQAAYQQQESFRILHALAYVGGCPMEIAQLAISLYPEQTSMCDENGNLPLHLLCCSEPANKDDCQSLLQALLSGYPEGAQCANQSGRLPLNIALASGKGGNFTRLLVAAEPRVLMGTRDVVTGLPSFALAAAAPTLETHLFAYNASDVGSLWHFLPPHAQQERLQQARRDLEVIQVGTIYEILRVMPDAVQFGLS